MVQGSSAGQNELRNHYFKPESELDMPNSMF